MARHSTDAWLLNPAVTYLNHGSFGACPRSVLAAQQDLLIALERDPIRFLAPERDLLPKLDRVRDRMSRLLGAPASDLVFVRNSTDGVNAVLRSFPFGDDGRVLITDHGYNACNNAARYAVNSERRIGLVGTNAPTDDRVDVASIPFPVSTPQQVVDAVESEFREETRLLLIDHVTSPTGLVFPIEQIIAKARARGIRVLVDGAHAPGMLALNLGELRPDYYTGNHHKWLCAPKTSGFLYVDPRWQEEVRPTVISHGVNSGDMGATSFHREFNWTGTFDPTPLLCVPESLAFLEGLDKEGLPGLMGRNRDLALKASRLLCEGLDIEAPVPPEMIGSLASLPIDGFVGNKAEEVAELKRWLYNERGIELPVFLFRGTQPMLRVSAAAYNELSDYEVLLAAMHSFRKR